MSIQRVLGTAITSLTLTLPTAKAENQIAGAIYNSSLPQKISQEIGGAIFNSQKVSRIATDTFKSSSAITGEVVNVTSPVSGKISTSSTILPSSPMGGTISNSQQFSQGIATDTFKSSSAITGEVVNVTSPISGKISTSSTIPTSSQVGGVISDIGSETEIPAYLQVFGISSITNKWGIPISRIELPKEIKDVKKIVNGTPRVVGDSVEFNSEMTYGDNQKTNVLVSGLNKAYRFFKTQFVDLANDNRMIN